MRLHFSSMRWLPSRLALAAATALLGSSLAVVVAAPAQAETLTALPNVSVTSSGCTASGSAYSCSSPTVTLSGTGADPTTSVVVADSNGFWLGEAKSDGAGTWSISVTLLANTNPYSLDAFEVGATPGAQGGSSPTVAVTVTGNQLIANGSFEQPSVAALELSWYNFGPTIPGWAATNSCGIELQTQSTVGVSPYDGSQYAELASNCVSGLTQTLATVPGTQYTLSFAYQARPGTGASANTMAVEWGGLSVAPTLQGGPSWTVATYTVTAASTTTVLEFDDTDQALGDSEGDFLDGVSVVPTAAQAPSNTSWSNAQAVTLAAGTGGQSTGNAAQSITFSGEGLWYDFSVQPGEQVSVQLKNLAANYRVLLFSDIAQAQASLGSGAPNIPVVQAESSGNNDSSATFSPFYGAPFYGAPFYGAPFYGAPFYGAPFYGAPFYGAAAGYSPFYGAPFYGAPFYGAADDQAAEADSILAESSGTAPVDQSVQANTWNDTGNFYVEILSDNGGFSSQPYSLTVSTSGGPCQGVTLNNFSGDLNTPVPGGTIPGTLNSVSEPYAAVIVDNSAAMAQVSPTAGPTGIYSSLGALAAKTNGVVLDVAQSLGVKELINQAQANSSCPYAQNLEAQGIQALINTYRAYGPSGTATNNLKYVVIVGDDHVIPFFRYADAETIGPENTYQVPLLSTSAGEAALQGDYYLTDNQYGAASELSINNTLLPIQSAAVGRLVETPADIQGAITRYLAQPTVNVSSTLTTGYSFMAPPATQAGQYFASGVPGSPSGPGYNDSLIDPQTGGNPWNASTLLGSLTSRAHQLVFLGAHFSASDALAADDTTYLSTQQFAGAIGTNLQNSVVLGAGCHAGYTVDPADATPVTNSLSWPQAFTEAGATLIAGSGYQFGDSNYVADSDQVYVDLAQQLYQTGGGPVAVGTALLDAESQYLASIDQLNGLEEKSMLETTLYGLPMLGVQEPGSVSTSPVPTPSTTGALGSAITLPAGTPGNVLGTQAYDMPVNVPTLPSVTPPGNTLSYDQGPQGEVADPGSPVVPVMTQDVNLPNYTLTGVGFFGGSYQDTSGPAPLTGDPVTDLSQPATPFSSPVYYPEKLTNPNYFGTLDTGSGTELGITPEQYISDPSTPGNAIKRQYSSLDLHLFYSNNTSNYGGNVPALAASPDISSVSATDTGGMVTVSATVTGDPSAGLQEVWVTYTDPPSSNGPGTWASTDLTQSSTNSTLWTATFADSSPSGPLFMVQAANGVGEVSLDNNDGYYFSSTLLASVTSPPPSLATSSLTLGGDTTDVFGTTAGVSASLSSTPSGSTTPAPLNGAQVTFSVGSATATATTGPSGSAKANIPLAGLTPGTYTLTASFPGDAGDMPTSAIETFVVTAGATGLSLTVPPPGQITSGALSGINATLTSSATAGGVGQKTVYFDVANSANVVVAGSAGVTSASGVAQAGVITIPPGDVGAGYSVTAYFGSSATPLPNGGTYNAADPDFAAAASPTLPVSVVDPTQTSVSFTPNPVFGQPLTVTATVASANSLGTYPAPTGDGTVAFYQGTSTTPITGCSAVTVTAGAASCPVAGPLAVGGPYSFSATYTSNTPNFLGSSGQATVSVGMASTTTVLTAPSTSQFGAPVLLSAQVAPVSPGAGTPTGTVTFYNGATVVGSQPLAVSKSGADVASALVDGLQGGAQALSATYSGDWGFLPSTGTGTDTVTFTKTISAPQTGALVVGPGQSVLITSTGRVSGAVTVQPFGALAVQGGTITGAVSAAGSDGVTLCGATIGGALSVSASLGSVLMGGSPACANTVSGSVSLAFNLGGLEIANTTVKGAMTVAYNTDFAGQQNGAYPPAQVAGNTISGALSCTGNVPPPIDDGQPNTSASRSGQCIAPKF